MKGLNGFKSFLIISHFAPVQHQNKQIDVSYLFMKINCSFSMFRISHLIFKMSWIVYNFDQFMIFELR